VTRAVKPRCGLLLVKREYAVRCRLNADHAVDHRWWGGAAKVEWTDRGVVTLSTTKSWLEGARYEPEWVT